MFFPERIKGINEGDKVLEVGPGASPYYRSDVLLERSFTADELLKQNGNNGKLVTDKKIVFYNGGIFPFNDKEFDYVVCSHVLEHVDSTDIPLFLNELSRVAHRGYIEFPTIYYEWLYNFDVHVSLLFYDNVGCLNYREKDKQLFKTGIHRFFFESLLRGHDELIVKLSNYFFQGFEWKNKIVFERRDDIESFCFTVEQLDLVPFNEKTSFRELAIKKIKKKLGIK